MGAIGGPGIVDVQRQQLRDQEAPQRAPAQTGSALSQLFQQQLKARIRPTDSEGRRPIPLAADTQSGVPGWVRATLSARLDPQGRVSLLEETYGKGNVWSLTDEAEPHDLFVQTWTPLPAAQAEQLEQILPAEAFRIADDGTPEVFRFVQVDPQDASFDTGEVFDVAADVAQSIPSVAGGIIGGVVGGPGGAATGSAVGDIVGSYGRQLTSAALPGEEGLTPADRAMLFGVDVVGGLVGDVAAKGIAKGIEAVRPGNVLRRTLRGTDEAAAIEGRRLRQSTGVNFSVAQETQGRTASRFEAMLRQDPAAADLMFNEDVARMKQLGASLDAVIDRFGGAIGKENAGAAIASTADNYLRNLAKARSKAARVLFGRAERQAGAEQIIGIRNFTKALNELQEEHSGPLSRKSDTSKKILEKLDEVRRNIYAERSRDKQGRLRAVRLTIKEFQDDLSVFGQLAAGTGNFIKDIDKAKDRRISMRLFKALKDDLAAIEDRKDLRPEIKNTLQRARRGYAKMSSVLESAQSKVIRDALKLQEEGAPDTIAKKLIGGGWSDVQVREAMRFLDKVDPVTANSARASALKQIMEKSAPTSEALLSRDVVVTPAKLSSAILRNKDRMHSIMGQEKAFRQLEDIRSAAGRLADAAGAGPGGSQTAPMIWMRRVLQELGPGSAAINPRAFISQVVTLMNANRLARALADAEGRRIVLDTLKLGENPRNAIRVIARLAAWNERESIALTPKTPERKQEASKIREQATERAMRFAPAAL